MQLGLYQPLVHCACVEGRTVDVDFVRSFYEKHVHPNVLEPLLAAKNKRYVVLLEGGEIVAAVSLQRRAFGLEQVGGLLIVPERRGQGLTWELLPVAMREAGNWGSRYLVGGVYRRKPDVSPIYRRLGFKTWIPFIPGAKSWGPLGWSARLMAKLFGVAAGPYAIRIMAGRVPKSA